MISSDAIEQIPAKQQKKATSLKDRILGTTTEKSPFLTLKVLRDIVNNVTSNYRQLLSEKFKEIYSYDQVYGWIWDRWSDPELDVRYYRWEKYNEEDIPKIANLASDAINILKSIKRDITNQIQKHSVGGVQSSIRKRAAEKANIENFIDKEYKLDWLHVDHLEEKASHPSIQKFGWDQPFVLYDTWVDMKATYKNAMGSFLWSVLPQRFNQSRGDQPPKITLFKTIDSLEKWGSTMKGRIMQNKAAELSKSGLSQNLVNQFTSSVKGLKADIRGEFNKIKTYVSDFKHHRTSDGIAIITSDNFRVDRKVQLKMKQIKKYLVRGYIKRKFTPVESALIDLLDEAIELSKAIDKDEALVVKENRRMTIKDIRKIIRSTLA